MTRPVREVAKIRINLDMPLAVKDRITDIRDQTNADSMGEVIRRAVTVYDLILSEQALGNTVVIRSPSNGDKQIIVV